MSKKTKLTLRNNTLKINDENEMKCASWTQRFRHIHNDNLTYWFWDHFDWNKQSLWIGKFNRMNHLPLRDDQIINFLNKLINDLNQNTELKNKLYIKFYFTRNINNSEPEINYLLISDSQQLPPDFSDTLINIVFERYQLTENIINQNENFRKIINHYIDWGGYYPYQHLMSSIHN